MSESQTLLLGFIAGVTILIGLPLGRMRAPRPGVRQFLNALAIGILLFLIWDVLVHAFEPIDTALGRLHDGSAGIGPVLGYAALFFLGLAVGLMSLVYYEAWLARRRKPRNFGPGTMAPGELAAAKPGIAGWSAARRMSLLIAVGIGLHNFGEGLAIGGSAATGEIELATVLVIGFALHNGTEGFGIVAPLAAEDDRPSWGFLLLMGLIGGGPTIAGTAIGRQFTSEAMSVIFLSLAAGSILYVVIQLLGVAHKNGRKELLYWGVLLGLAAGFITDMVVTAGGA
ncbi:MAG TPA: ZIP family metal transporter [Streptosporangiaceae bacterium]|nr:ZIP family metal transporter [Streptosporangiaceae bacterium]